MHLDYRELERDESGRAIDLNREFEQKSHAQIAESLPLRLHWAVVQDPNDPCVLVGFRDVADGPNLLGRWLVVNGNIEFPAVDSAKASDEAKPFHQDRFRIVKFELWIVAP